MPPNSLKTIRIAENTGFSGRRFERDQRRRSGIFSFSAGHRGIDAMIAVAPGAGNRVLPRGVVNSAFGLHLLGSILVRARMLPERPSEFLPDRSVYVKIQSGRFRRNLAHPQVVTAALFTQAQNY
jgi:hypothetical protein